METGAEVKLPFVNQAIIDSIAKRRGLTEFEKAELTAYSKRDEMMKTLTVMIDDPRIKPEREKVIEDKYGALATERANLLEQYKDTALGNAMKEYESEVDEASQYNED